MKEDKKGNIKKMELQERKTYQFEKEMPPIRENIEKLKEKIEGIYVTSEKKEKESLEKELLEKENIGEEYLEKLAQQLTYLVEQVTRASEENSAQQIDFLDSFLHSLDGIIRQSLEEKMIQEESSRKEEEIIHLQKTFIEEQLERQIAYYQSYRVYTESFSEFKVIYQNMMGRVYQLFEENKMEEARLLIAEINDQMNSMVLIHKEYCNHPLINAIFQDVANQCRQHKIEWKSKVYLPSTLKIPESAMVKVMIYLSTLLLDLGKEEGESFIDMRSAQKGNWIVFCAKITYHEQYNIDDSYYLYPPKNQRRREELIKIEEILEEYGCMFQFELETDLKELQIYFYLA